MIRRFVLACGILVSLAFVSTAAFAQDASVIGNVADETKAVLPGVTISATNLDTGAETFFDNDRHVLILVER